MEILLPAVVLLLIVLLALVLFVPGLALLFALALPVGAIVWLVRLLHPNLTRVQPVTAKTAGAALAGAGGQGGIGTNTVPGSLPRQDPLPRDRPRPQKIELTSAVRRAPATAPEFRSGEALFAFDSDLRVVSWNQGAAELTGIPLEQALGRHCWELLGGVDADGNIVCHADCRGARLASQAGLVEGQPLLIKTAASKRRAVWLSTIAVRGEGQPLTLHLLRNGTSADRSESLSRRN